MVRVETSRENVELCQKDWCGPCPSFPGVQGEALYCAVGGSKGKVERKGCNCPDCPIWEKCGLSEMYYCAKKPRAGA
jgi:hypothetical protein